jgi:hypothetical protein
MAEMKFEGIEYDKRMEELEKLEHPKPNREFIYSSFNTFADKHPWVGQENIRPKSIAREMFESFRSFSDSSASFHKERRMSSFGIYVIGFVILVVGLALAANMLGIPTVWIGIGAIVLIGIAVLSGVAKTRQRDRPDT